MLDLVELMPLFQSLDEESSFTWTHRNRRSVEFCLQFLFGKGAGGSRGFLK